MQWDDYSIVVKSIGNVLESERDPPPGWHVKMLVASLPCGLSLIKHARQYLSSQATGFPICEAFSGSIFSAIPAPAMQ